MTVRHIQTLKILGVLVVLLTLLVGVQTYDLYAGGNPASEKEAMKSSATQDREAGDSRPAASGDDSDAPSHRKDEGGTGAGDKENAGEPPLRPDENYFTTPFDADIWDPFVEMRRMQHHIDRMFAESFNRFGRSPRFESLVQPEAFSPDLDVVEKEDRFIVKVDLPGTDATGVEVTLDDRILTLKGERVHAVKQEDDEGRFIRRERRVGKFARSITLPGPVDPAGMKTSQEEGILTVEIPKAKDS